MVDYGYYEIPAKVRQIWEKGETAHLSNKQICVFDVLFCVFDLPFFPLICTFPAQRFNFAGD